MPFRPSHLLAAVLLVAPLAAQTSLTTRLVANGFSRPVELTAPRSDTQRVFLVEQTGLIKVIKNGRTLATPFLDLRSEIRCCGERGLLGLAFHPKYGQNGYFFVNYTDRVGSTRVVRYRVSSNPDVADPRSASLVIGPISQPYGNHNGGCLRFGPDGYLYIGLGDGGSSGDPGCRAQNGQSLLGKMLRIDVDVASGYAIPKDNPFLKDAKVRNEIWALGLRNPWRYAFDRVVGDLYIGDVGQGFREEITWEAKGAGGANHGWKIMEGDACYGTFNCVRPPACRSPVYTMPIQVLTRAQGRSITGGYVYRGCAIPDLRGTYFFGDYVTRRVWSFRWDGKSKSNFQERTVELAPGGSLSIGRISSFGEDADGELYILDYLDGEVFKIVPRTTPPVRDLGFGKVGGNGLTPYFDACGMLNSGNSAEFRLNDAPPTALSLLVVSTQNNPTRLFGGILLPVPPQIMITFVSDARGKVRFVVPGGGGPLRVYAQYAILDAKATQGFGFSNALQIDFQK